MAVRTRRLAHTTAVPDNTWRGLYTVPAGRTAIVRAMAVFNRSGATVGVQLRVRSASAVVWIWGAASVADASGALPALSGLALNPGDVLEFLATGAGTGSVHWTVAGSLLLGEPS